MNVLQPWPRVPPVASIAARHAVRALYAEVTLEPKPGLVSLRDNGSHTDMNAATFVRSLFALRHYFCAIAQAGVQGQPFAALQALGLAAEVRMLAATGGVNTHRGAVFALGLLCAAAGRVQCQDQGDGQGGGQGCAPHTIRAALQRHWGEALRTQSRIRAEQPAHSNGQRAARAYGLRSALDEAADGFPTLFDTTLPALQTALQQGHGLRAARVQALFATMAVLDDTNVAHRGGPAALASLQRAAGAFVRAGGVAQADWLAQARSLHAQCVAQHLSPGGSADVLACACWLHTMQEACAPLHRPTRVVMETA